MDESLRELGEHIQTSLEEDILDVSVDFGELTVLARADQIVKVMKFLRDDPACRFSCLMDVCGVDYPARDKRFDVVYHLLSPYQNHRVRVRVHANEETPVPSVVEVFPTANWFERETFDLLGVMFSNHPDLRRILTDYGFSGHPLRKDFPVSGYVEVRYDDELKRVVYEPTYLAQDMRSFDFMSPWEGAKYILDEDAKGEAQEKGED